MPKKLTESNISLESVLSAIEQLEIINEELHVSTEAKLDAIQRALGKPGFDWDKANSKALLAAQARFDKKKQEFSTLQAKRKSRLN